MKLLTGAVTGVVVAAGVVVFGVVNTPSHKQTLLDRPPATLGQSTHSAGPGPDPWRAVVEDHPPIMVHGLTYARPSAAFIKVYAGHSATDRTFIILRQECGCVQSAVKESAVKVAGEPGFVTLPVRMDVADQWVEVRVAREGEPFVPEGLPLVSKVRISTLPRITITGGQP